MHYRWASNRPASPKQQAEYSSANSILSDSSQSLDKQQAPIERTGISALAHVKIPKTISSLRQISPLRRAPSSSSSSSSSNDEPQANNSCISSKRQAPQPNSSSKRQGPQQQSQSSCTREVTKPVRKSGLSVKLPSSLLLRRNFSSSNNNNIINNKRNKRAAAKKPLVLPESAKDPNHTNPEALQFFHGVTQLWEDHVKRQKAQEGGGSGRKNNVVASRRRRPSTTDNTLFAGCIDGMLGACGDTCEKETDQSSAFTDLKFRLGDFGICF